MSMKLLSWVGVHGRNWVFLMIVFWKAFKVLKKKRQYCNNDRGRIAVLNSFFSELSKDAPSVRKLHGYCNVVSDLHNCF